MANQIDDSKQREDFFSDPEFKAYVQYIKDFLNNIQRKVLETERINKTIKDIKNENN